MSERFLVRGVAFHRLAPELSLLVIAAPIGQQYREGDFPFKEIITDIFTQIGL